ncbi:PREDICTED: polygalacturonase inhibitor-like [Nelumbo nucifera]|uniref:Polygalacturonase inhibitor-like n=2 Tax=Nelumbo nucifera TaxID=4432 RepID=A0A1U8ASM6_NELNU|nr:PREDICTED: polygalacturonase inhibitor-like [Nelumbo nucifera]DAD29907.1 TPA_asm: hypothetical protein HUJ06_031375 [Nelumbo nucifera]
MEICRRGSACSPSSFLFLILFLLFISSSFPSLTLSASFRCHPDDKNALLNIKKSIDIPKDSYVPWDPNTDCCEWEDVTCDPNTNRVTGLEFRMITVFGQIPASISNLPYLETFVLALLKNDKLPGCIPDSFAKLHNLKRLEISWSPLSCRTPEFLGQLKNLEYLDLSHNKLHGPIPSSLANLSKLVHLRLNDNKLTGRIPNSLSALNVELIDLSFNKLTGDASMFLRADGKVKDILLTGNRLDFDMSMVGFPKNLKALHIGGNRIRGRIPEQVTELKRLEAFDVSFNRLCGRIPVGGNMQKLIASYFYHNRCLCGLPLPNKCKS